MKDTINELMIITMEECGEKKLVEKLNV